MQDKGKADIKPVPTVCIIVPTYRERDNVRPLHELVHDILPETDWQIVFVDDNSPDGTFDEAESLAGEDRRVRVTLRVHERGLTSAVLTGIWSANTQYIVVTDADLQHDLHKIPEMLDILNTTGADLVVGTRYGKDGSAASLSSPFRAWLSRTGTKLAQVVIPVAVTDPMSGFFAFDRRKLLPVLAKVDPLGFKVLFDILLIGGRTLRIAEVPYSFRPRHAGLSKLDWRTQYDFLIQVVYHLLRRTLPHDLISFLAIGASGAVLYYLSTYLALSGGATAFAADAIAITLATVWNFCLNHHLTFHRSLRPSLGLLLRFAMYAAAVAVGVYLQLNAATIRIESLTGANLLVAGLGIAVDVTWRFAISRAIIWAR